MSDFWPHKFTKDGKETIIDKVPMEGIIGEERLITHQPMICVHCNIRFIQGKEPRPADPCPARKTSKEMKRLKNGW